MTIRELLRATMRGFDTFTLRPDVQTRTGAHMSPCVDGKYCGGPHCPPRTI